MALEWHRRMLGSACQGLDENRCLVPIIAHNYFVLLSLLIRTLVFHVHMFIIVEIPKAFPPLLYRAV